MEEEAIFIFYTYTKRFKSSTVNDRQAVLTEEIHTTSRGTVYKSKNKNEVADRINVLFDPKKYIDNKQPVFAVLVGGVEGGPSEYTIEYKPISIVEKTEEAEDIQSIIEKGKGKTLLPTLINKPLVKILPILLERE